MSDDFIPLNQSTPVGGRWHGHSQRGQQNNRFQNGPRRGNNWRGNNSQRNSSFGGNSTYGSDMSSSFGQDKSSIDAYLHPSMLQDPWAQLRMKIENNKQDNPS